MKKFFTILFAVAAVFTLAADDILIWKPDFTKLMRPNSGTGIWCNKKKGFACKATATKDVLTLTVEKNPGGTFMDAQGMILYGGKYEKGVKYEVSYKIKANKDVKIWASVAMGKPPWKAFKSEYVELEANDAEEVDFDFVIPKDYEGKLRLVFLGLGNATDGTTFEISDFKFEKDVDKD